MYQQAQQWEYLVGYFYYSELDEKLSELGVQGWELVSVVGGEEVRYTLFFKRPVEKIPMQKDIKFD